MNGTDPPIHDRRASPRRSSSYTPEEISELRIERVHFRDQYIFCLLSNGSMVCVPLSISRMLESSPERMRYNYQLMEEGKTVAWYSGRVGIVIARLSVGEIVSHPEAQVTELPDGEGEKGRSGEGPDT
jgi:hypothetical protein